MPLLIPESLVSTFLSQIGNNISVIQANFVLEHSPSPFSKEQEPCCDLCPRPIAKMIFDSITSHAAEYLHNMHRTSETREFPINQTTIRQKPPVNIIVLRKLIFKWVVGHHHSFIEIEADSFHRIIAYLDLTRINKLSRSANTICSDIVQYFKKQGQWLQSFWDPKSICPLIFGYYWITKPWLQSLDIGH